MRVMDLKMFDSIGSDGLPSIRGAMVQFGNTLPAARELVHGLEERGTPDMQSWNWQHGRGYVKAVPGDYAKARACGCDVRCLLVECFGGMGPELVELLKELAEARNNRLNAGEYDATTWAARSWTAFSTQKLSVAVHLAAAHEVAGALGLATAGDSRGRA